MTNNTDDKTVVVDSKNDKNIVERFNYKKVFHNVKKVFSFIQNHALIFTLLFVLALQFVPNGEGAYPWGGIYTRMQLIDFPLADRSAESGVDNFATQKATELAKAQYPNLPDANLQKVVADLKKKILEENAVQLNSEKARLAGEIREHYMYEENGEKFIYMPDIDPYYYLRFARNIVETGKSYDILKDGVPWDNHVIAPIGSTSDKSWHEFTLAFIYKIHKIFDSKTTLMDSANYFPVIIIFLSLIFVFLIGFEFAGPVGGFFSATILALLPAIMGRTLWGHADTDAYQIFFPVLIIWLLIKALSAKTWKYQLAWSGLIGASFILFSKCWGNWWYLFDFIGGALFIGIVLDVIFNFKSLKQGVVHFWNNSKSKILFFVGACIFVFTMFFSLFTDGLKQFLNSTLFVGIGYTTLKDAVGLNLWPNTLTTVAELNPGSFNTLVSSVGGKLLFFLALIGILFLFFRKENNKNNFVYGILLSVWFIGTAYMTLKGIRFVLLIGPAFAVAFGVCAGKLFEKLSDLGKRISIPKLITGCLIILLLCVVIVNPSKSGQHMVKESFASAVNDLPIMNDAWWNTLIKIRDNSQPDAIINSWWDFGHHFKYVADRAVSFDGASQTLPHAHWVGRALQTDNEDEAVGILRMLDCGSYTAVDVANEKFNDSMLAIDFVKKLILLDKESARKEAQSAGVSERILDLTHCDAPEDFFIASQDMVSKSGVWGHFGLWDFDRAEAWIKWRNVPETEAVPKMSERFNISKDEAQKMYDKMSSITSETEANSWISTWPSYVTGPSACSVEGNILNCGNIRINSSSGRAEVRVDKGIAIAKQVFAFDKFGKKTVLSSSDFNADVSVVMWPTETGISVIAATSPLADSMFTRLFFMDGLGLKHFKPFETQQQLMGGMIYTYKVDWMNDTPFIPDSLKPKDSIVQNAKVSLNYIGWTDEGIFDSSIIDWKSKNITPDSVFVPGESKPLSFVFGQGRMIPGFEKGILGMKKGDVKVLTILPEEGYGVDPTKHPLANKTLKFKVKVELVE